MARYNLLVAALAIAVLSTPIAFASHIPGDEYANYNMNCVWHQETVVFVPFCSEDEILTMANAIDTYLPMMYDYFALGVNTGYQTMVDGYCLADANGYFPDWYEIPPCAEIPSGPLLP